MKKRVITIALAVLTAVSLAVPAIAADTAAKTKSVRVSADYDQDGTKDFSYIIPGVLETGKVMMGDEAELKADQYPELKLLAGKELTMLTIKAGAQISIAGGTSYSVRALKPMGGKLVETPMLGDEAVISGDNLKRVTYPNGAWHGVFQEGDYFSFTKAGYYIFDLCPFVPQRLNTDPGSQGFLTPKNQFKYSRAVLHVIDDKAE